MVTLGFSNFLPGSYPVSKKETLENPQDTINELPVTHYTMSPWQLAMCLWVYVGDPCVEIQKSGLVGCPVFSAKDTIHFWSFSTLLANSINSEKRSSIRSV